MSQFDPQDYALRALSVETPDDADALFADIAKLADMDRPQAVDAIETAVVSQFTRGIRPSEIAQLKMVIEMIEQAKDTPQGKMIRAQLESQSEMVDEGRAIGQVIFHIHQAKGDTAAPLIQSYVEEAGKLSDEEYGTGLGTLKIMVNVAEKEFNKNKPAPANPFRKPSAPQGPAA